MCNFQWKISPFFLFLTFLLVPGRMFSQELELSGKFENCSPDLVFKLKLSNKTKAGIYESFRIDWGDGTSPDVIESSASHEYKTKGRFNLLFYGKKADGTEDYISYPVYNDGGTPELKLAAGGEGGLCQGSEISFVLSGLEKNTDLTSYTLDYGDGAKELFMGDKYSGQSEIVFKHQYTKSYCDFLAEGGDVSGMKIKIRAVNACGGVFEMTAGPYKVASPLNLKYLFPEKECTGNPIDFAGLIKYEPEDCMAVNVIWDLVGLEDDVATPYVFDQRGNYTVRANATREDIECSRAKDEKVLKIIQRVKARVTPSRDTICEGESVRLDASASEGDEKEFNWSVVNGNGLDVQWQPNRKSALVDIVFTRHGTYRLQLQVDNGCSYDYAYVDVVVKKNPEIVYFKSLPNICPNKLLRMRDYVAYDWTWAGNPHTPTWTIEGPEGGVKFELGNIHSEYPDLKFTKPGIYTLTVELKGVGCGDESKQKASRTIEIYDDAITGEITHTDTELCEGGKVIFTNSMQGVNLATTWTLTNSSGVVSPEEYEMVTVEETKTVTYIFKKYGNYKVRALLTAECTEVVREFPVKVYKAPEVYFKEFPEIVCPEIPFLPGDYVSLLPNGNDLELHFTWEVSSTHEAALVEGTNSRDPKITFPTYGDYTIKLTINNPVPFCTSPSLSISKVISVSNPEMNLKITPDRNTICIGEQVHFTNTSQIAVEPAYYWGVSPGGYHFPTAEGETSAHPVIQFDQSGIYSVTAVVNGVCRPETIPFTIIVQQDPEVVLNEIPAICPGMLQLSDSLVHYTWNDSWKSGAESTRRVVWKLLSKPDYADCTPPESVEWDSFYPNLKLNTPGRYELQVEVKSDAACQGTQRLASREVMVYDPNLQVEVRVVENGQVVQLGYENYQVVEGSTLMFSNLSQGEGLHCVWSVDQPEYVEISDPTAHSPSMVFRKFGTYRVRVDLIGTCSQDFREFTIVVKGIPKFNFESIANRCEQWEEDIDLRDYLTCDSAGSTEIICNWEITPTVGYTVTEGTLSDMFYKIRFEEAGKYTLTLSAKAEYGGVQVYSRIVHVLRQAITAKAELSKSEGCTTDGLEMIAVNHSLGEALTCTWQMTPLEGRNIEIRPDTLLATVLQAGNYEILLRAENICGSDEVGYPIRAYSMPEVEVLGDLDLNTVCERDYRFVGSEHVGEIKINNDPLKLVRWIISSEGVKWENNTGYNSERPDMSFKGGKNYVITGNFKNGCKDTVKIKYTVAVDQYIPVELFPDTVVCARTQPFRLNAQPEGGHWRCTDALALKEVEGEFYFDPYLDEYKIYELVYEKGNGQCQASDTSRVTVNSLPVVNAGGDRGLCLNAGPLELRGEEPVVGVWKGKGVQEEKWFHPEESGAGDFRLEFWYTDAATGCPNLDTVTLTVHVLPDVAFNVSDQQCRETDSLYVPVELGLGHHFFWDFGNGETLETDDMPAKYHYPEVGVYPVVLTATSVHHCKVTGQPQQVKVLNLPPPARFTLTDTADCGPFKVLPVVKPEDFAEEYYNLKYLWDYGNGRISAELLPEEQIYSDGLFDTTYQIVFKVYNVCGEQVDTAEVGVWSKAVARFTMNPEEEGCTPAEVQFINHSTGSHNRYIWNFGDGQTAETTDTTYVFTTASAMSVYDITLSAYNICTPAGTTFKRSLKVKPNTILTGFSKSTKYLCAGDTVYFENTSVDRNSEAALSCSWDFGDGQVTSLWDTCHRYTNPGTYPITLKVDNGCTSKEFRDSVTVNVLPVLQLNGDNALCEDLDLQFEVSSDVALKNIIWDFADGIRETNGAFKVKHAFEEPGIYTVRVQGEADQIPACVGEAVKIVEIWSNPRVRIEPLDTMNCPPLLYHPDVRATSYDYFTWDYGDGTPLTSEMEHIYANDSNVILDYQVTAYVENNFGCKEEHHGVVRVYNGPRVAWNKEIAFGRPEKVRFINLSRDFSEAIWYLPFGEEVHVQEDQTVVFENESVYPIALAVVNQYGCRDSIWEEYRSYKGGLYFPNTFIPHSTNLKVNQFNGIGMGLKEYKLEIFDMYGNKVWETTALEGGVPSGGWEGRNKKGELLPQGVYTWRAEAVFFSEDVWTGGNNRSGVPQTTQGTVLMLRK